MFCESIRPVSVRPFFSLLTYRKGDKKICYAEVIRKVVKILPSNICPRKQEETGPVKPVSGIEVLSPELMVREDIALSQSPVVLSTVNYIQSEVLSNSHRSGRRQQSVLLIFLWKNLRTRLERFPYSLNLSLEARLERYTRRILNSNRTLS